MVLPGGSDRGGYALEKLPRMLFAALLLACSQPAMAAEPAVESAEDFARYVNTFNAADPGFVEYYSQDVVFDKGPPEGQLIGRNAIAAWYAQLWASFDETITPMALAFDSRQGVLMVELRTQLTARRDGVTWRDRVYDKGDRLIVDGVVIYTLQNGLISSLRGASDIREIIPADSGAAEGH